MQFKEIKGCSFANAIQLVKKTFLEFPASSYYLVLLHALYDEVN